MNKMKTIFGWLLLGSILVSCGSGEKTDESVKGTTTEVPSVEVLLKQLSVLEDSLLRIPTDIKTQESQIPKLTQMAVIENALLIYQTYPDHSSAAKCLEKVSICYSNLNAHEASAKYGDTLLMKYLNYPERKRVIENQIASYDYFIKPWDKKKVQKYYNMLKKEFPKLTAEEKEGMESRLKHMNLSGDQYIEFQMKQVK